MSYLSASKLTFSPKWADMSDDEQLAEQVAALDVVAKYGGDIKAQYVLWSDNCLLSVIDYPEEISALKAELAIVAARLSCCSSSAPFRSRTSCRGRTKCGRSRGSSRRSSGWLERDGALEPADAAILRWRSLASPSATRRPSPRCRISSMGPRSRSTRAAFSKTIAITC